MRINRLCTYLLINNETLLRRYNKLESVNYIIINYVLKSKRDNNKKSVVENENLKNRYQTKISKNK